MSTSQNLMLVSVIGVKLVSESESESFMHVVVVVVCCCWSVCVGRDTLHTLDHSCVKDMIIDRRTKEGTQSLTHYFPYVCPSIKHSA